MNHVPLKIESKKQLKTQIPSEGYVYLDLDSINNGISQTTKKVRAVAQKNGVILEYDDKNC